MDIRNQEQYYHGILRLEETEGGVRPMRFTDSETALYSVSEARRIRAAVSAGENIALVTDAASVRVDMTVLNMSRKCADLGLYLDGVKQPKVEVGCTEPGDYSAVIALDGQKHTVEIYLPHLSEVLLRAVEVSGCTVCGPIPKKKKVYLAYGDSITQGMEATDPAAIYPVLTARELDMELYDFGVGGATFLPGEMADNGLKADIVTAAYGINDWLSGAMISPEAFRDNVCGFCRNLIALHPEAEKFVISPFWIQDKAQVRSLGNFNDVTKRIAAICAEFASDGLHFIDGTSLVPNDRAYFNNGGVHPNELGFSYMAMKLLQILRPYRKE